MIPGLAHFVWYGSKLPWIHGLSVRTAANNGGFERLIVHHADRLALDQVWHELLRLPTVEFRQLDALEELESVPRLGPRLVDLYRELQAPAARSNVIRVALLLRQGGVYLDLDTVTVASLTPLREQADCFCGTERIAFPADLSYGRPLGYAAALWRSLVRDLVRRKTDGWQLFRRIEHWYPARANNAVLGAVSGHPLLWNLLERMVAVPPGRRRRRYELGTTLLQAALTEDWGEAVVVHPPPVFYPLGPEVSRQWFMPTRRLCLDQMLRPETRVVHWYASVRTERVVREATPEWIRKHAQCQPFSALVLPWIE